MIVLRNPAVSVGAFTILVAAGLVLILPDIAVLVTFAITITILIAVGFRSAGCRTGCTGSHGHDPDRRTGAVTVSMCLLIAIPVLIALPILDSLISSPILRILLLIHGLIFG